MRDEFKKRSSADRRQKQFKAIQLQLLDAEGKAKVGKVAWSVFDTRVCLPFWQWSHAMSSPTLESLRQLIKEGHDAAPDPIPRHDSPSAEFAAGDAWFSAQLT